MRAPLRIRTPRVSARVRTILAIAAVLAVGAGATGAAAVTLNDIPDPPAPPLGWAVNGAAQPVPAGFQLTRAGHRDEAGSAFWTTAVNLTAPTSIAFDATMSSDAAVGADGITLVFADALHGGDPHVAGESASALGYGGIPGVAVTLDTYQNIGEPSSNFVGVADGLDDNGSPNYLSTATKVPDLRAAPHHFEVDVTHDHIDLAIDGRTALSSDVALPSYAFVGFTASNGGYTDDHVVTNIRATASSGIGSIGGSPVPLATTPATAPPTTTPPAPPTTTPTTTPSTVPTPACVGVPMNRGQADIDAAPPGTTFCLSGTHDWTLAPKSGDRLLGPAVLDGEHSTQYAIEPADATNVLLSALEIRNYAPGYQQSAISANQWSSGWTLRDLQVHDNGTRSGGAGAALGPSWQVLGGRYFDNRQKGLTDALGPGATVDGTEIDHNNFTDDTYTTATVNCGDDAGGFKWVADNVTVTNSSVHDNACVGLWADINTSGATITNNHVAGNWAEGIFVEISHDATVSGNTVSGNGFRSFRGACAAIWLYGGGITVASSDHVNVADNTVSGNCNGITGTQENRPDGNPGLLQDVTIHDNTISGPGGKTGVGAFPVSLANLLTRNIVIANNTVGGDTTLCRIVC